MHGSCGAAQARERERLLKNAYDFFTAQLGIPNLCIFFLQLKHPLLKQGEKRASLSY